MPQAVVLLHELPDGRAHYDWLVEDLCIDGEHRLRAWRMDGIPDREGSLLGERIGLHRAVYLDYEGDIGGGRGTVRRLRRGEVLTFETGERSVEVAVRWAGGEGVVCRVCGRAMGDGTQGEDGVWVFAVVEECGSR